MNEGYKKVADIVFGIRIDESTHQVIDCCDISDNKNLYFHKYKIIGTKSFLFEDGSLVDTKLIDYNRQIELRADKVPTLSGTWFVAISKDKDSLVDCRYKLEFIRKRANSETSYITGFDSNISLPVYEKDGTLLTLVHGDTGCYEISTDYGIIMNYKTLKYDWYSIHENKQNSIVLGTENYFSNLTSLFSKIHHPILYERVEDNIKKFMNSYIIGSNYTGSLILPADCKYAHIMDIESIEDYSAFKIIFVKTFYIPKDVRIEFMCSFITLLIEDYLLARDQEATTNVRPLYTTITSLNSAGEYDRILDTLNSSENKDIMQSVLSKFEIKVY